MRVLENNIKKLLAIFLLFGIVGCGPSSDEKERIAAVTCSIIKETKNFESSVRVEKLNEASCKPTVRTKPSIQIRTP